MLTTAYIGLGSNLDDRRGHLDRAVDALRNPKSSVKIRVSPCYETRAVGGPSGQPVYLNAAAEVETGLTAIELLDVLQAIENQEGRVRRARWGERTLDLDLLLFGDEVRESDRLTLPHPRMATRMFVLAPLSKIAPEVIEPRSGKRIRELLANCQARPGVIDLPGWTAFAPKALIEVRQALSKFEWLILDSTAGDRCPTPTIRVVWKQASKATSRPWPLTVGIDDESESAAVAEVVTVAESIRSDGTFI